MAKAKTIKIGGGADYAKVTERLKLFNEACSNGNIHTEAIPLGDKMILKAVVSNGKGKETTGSAFGKVGGQKEYEKLETIAVGRALAFHGYLADGEIASSEEMEEFEDYKAEKIRILQQKVKKCETIEDLQKIWEENKGLGPVFGKIVTEKKNELTNS